MSEIADKVLPVIRETRSILLPHWGNAGEVRNKGGGAIDVVTKYDIETEEFLADRLGKITPDAKFYAEENGGDKDGERYWVCDPIDGTGHYVRGLPFCTTMLALVENDAVVFSARYEFINDHLYHASLGEGAYRNSERIHVSERSLNAAYVSWESHTERPSNMERYLKLRSKANVFNVLACGYECVMMASGKLDGRIAFDGFGKIWDYAPGSLLVSEAGGVATNIGNGTYNPNNLECIYANKPVYEALVLAPDAIFPLEK